MRRVNLQVDGLPVDALVVSCYPRCLRFDFTFDLGEVVEPPPGYMMELSPFLLACYTCWCMWDMYFVAGGFVVAVAGEVDELENERSPCYDAASPR
jgi:hypothetical protein